MEIAFSSRVIFRNSLGQFRQACAEAARETIEEAVEKGAQISRAEAPVGYKDDPRTIPLRDSIESAVLSRTSGHWYASARHALPQEFGATAHPIFGNPYLKFFWESAGRWWVPGLYGERDVVNHPGHGAQPYLRPAYNAVMNMVMSIAAAKYPG